MQSAGKLFRATALTFQGRIQKIQKGVAGTLYSSILDTFYFSETEFYILQIIQNFKGKGVAAAPSAHP